MPMLRHFVWLACLYLMACGPIHAQTKKPFELPLASNYNVGQLPNGFSPDWQVDMIKKGHHLLLTFHLPSPGTAMTDHQRKYYSNAMRYAAAHQLPISFVTQDMELHLYYKEQYNTLPADQTALVVTEDGSIQKRVSPLGAVEPWRRLGQQWTDNEIVRAMESMYPSPPYVLIIGNNEARKLNWYDAEKDSRYVARYGKGHSDDEKRRATGEGYVERFRAMIDAMHAGFDAWHGRVIIGAYGASPLRDMGMRDNWRKPRWYVPGETPYMARIWEAVSPSQYITTWNDNNDYTMFSPLAQAMNLVVQERVFRKVRPDLLWEVSVWDAGRDTRRTAKNKAEIWRKAGQQVGPERYRGFVKWMMWIPRARVVRDYRWWNETYDTALTPYQQVIAAVDEVHNHETIAEFWQHGELVHNPARQHPYQVEVPADLADEPRWFQLDCDANAPWPWTLKTQVNVWAFAHVLGEKPDRRWLVYTFSPLATLKGVSVTLPGYTAVKLSAAPRGLYHMVNEKTGGIVRVGDQ